MLGHLASMYHARRGESTPIGAQAPLRGEGKVQCVESRCRHCPLGTFATLHSADLEEGKKGEVTEDVVKSGLE